jgi:regulator of CtrA degradation
MTLGTASIGGSDRLAESLYTEALVLTDETRSYFDAFGAAERQALEAQTRISFGCEALKATTRLMEVTAWLAARRARPQGGRNPAAPQLPDCAPSDPEMLGMLPTAARRLILAGIDLHGRVARFAQGLDQPTSIGSPARAIIARFDRAS